MILDAQLFLFDKEKATAEMTSRVLDFNQDKPRVGMTPRQFVVLVRAGEGFAADSVQLTLEHSDDGTTFTPLATGSAITNFEQAIIPAPLDHKRYLRLKATLVGTPAGTLNAVLTDNWTDLHQIDLPLE